MYNILVERKPYDELKNSINAFDKIYDNLNKDLQHLYMLSTGKLIYDALSHAEGINRLEKALKLRDTPWINYRLGVAYCLNLEHLKSIVYLEKALNSYSMMGRYRNSLECHSFLGSSYAALKMYDQAESNFMAVLNGSDYFTLNKNIFSAYVDLARLYFNIGRYQDSVEYCQLAMNPPNSSAVDDPWLKAAWHTNEQAMIAACIYIEVQISLNNTSKCKEIFDKYLTHTYESSIYYGYLHSLYLSIYHFDEDIFYDEITNIILPHYKKIGYLSYYNKIQLLLIKHLEAKRRYKEANSIYKSLLGLA
jgi:tetratricopeptide (TPR) repeat protein